MSLMPIITPGIALPELSFLLPSLAEDTGNKTTYPFSSLNFGAAAPDRVLIGGVTASGGSGRTRT
jgi:hypothetical protein